MKYTFTFETSEAGKVPKKKINNFLKQVIDGINGIDEKSPNKDDYSITENVKDVTCDLGDKPTNRKQRRKFMKKATKEYNKQSFVKCRQKDLFK